MPCDLHTFCCNTRLLLQQQPLPGALPLVALSLQDLLANPAFVDATFDDHTPAGKRLLYCDADTGFLVLAHVQGAGKGGAPHDHGASWAVYGNARGRTDMTEYRRVNDPLEAHVVWAPQRRYSLNSGQTRAYPSGTVHATAHPEKVWVLRITGTDLDQIPRYRFRQAVDTLLDGA
jgi:predicted metal-dependent enzyme (double-stranded beta helix superfamily)